MHIVGAALHPQQQQHGHLVLLCLDHIFVQGITINTRTTTRSIVYNSPLTLSLTTGNNRAVGGGLAVLASLCASNDSAGSTARVTERADDPTNTRCRNGPRNIGSGRSSCFESELAAYTLVHKRCCRRKKAGLASIQWHESAIGAAVVGEADEGGNAQLRIICTAYDKRKKQGSSVLFAADTPHTPSGTCTKILFAPPSHHP